MQILLKEGKEQRDLRKKILCYIYISQGKNMVSQLFT